MCGEMMQDHTGFFQPHGQTFENTSQQLSTAVCGTYSVSCRLILDQAVYFGQQWTQKNSTKGQLWETNSTVKASYQVHDVSVIKKWKWGNTSTRYGKDNAALSWLCNWEACRTVVLNWWVTIKKWVVLSYIYWSTCVWITFWSNCTF